MIHFELKVDFDNPINQTALIGLAGTLKWKDTLSRSEILNVLELINANDFYETVENYDDEEFSHFITYLKNVPA